MVDSTMLEQTSSAHKAWVHLSTGSMIIFSSEFWCNIDWHTIKYELTGMPKLGAMVQTNLVAVYGLEERSFPMAQSLK